MNRLDEVGDDFRDAPMAALYEVSNKIKQIPHNSLSRRPF